MTIALTVIVVLFAVVFPLAGGGGEVEICGVTILDEGERDDPLRLILSYILGLAQGLVNQAAPSVAPFEPNLGQFDPSVAFASNSPGWSFSMNKNGKAELRFRTGAKTFHSVRLGLEGNEVTAMGRGDGLLPGRANYLMGRDPSKWATDVPRFEKVRYRGVYPGIDEIHSFNQGRIETDFEVRPGADPHRIRIRLEGVDRLDIDSSDGSLVMHTGDHEVR